MWTVDRQLVEVRPAQPGQLSVQIGEQPGLHQRIVGNLDTGYEVGDVERNLLGLSEAIGGIAVQRQRPTGWTGAHSSGTSLVGSSRSIPSKVWSSESGMICKPSSNSRNAPALRRRAPGMHNPLRDPLVVEMGDLLPQVE